MEANGCSGHSIWVPADCRAGGAWAHRLCLCAVGRAARDPGWCQRFCKA